MSYYSLPVILKKQKQKEIKTKFQHTKICKQGIAKTP